MYRVIFSPDAKKDVIKLKKTAPAAFKKLIKIYRNSNSILALVLDNASS